MDYRCMMGMRIREKREELNLTQTELGAALGLNKSTIQRYETGKITKIKLPVINAIAEYLNVDPAWLKGITNDPVNYDDPDLIAEIPQAIIEHFDGNIKKAYAAWKAADTDNETSTKAADVKLTEKEVTVALAYRAHPNEQTAVDRILEINGEAQNDDEEFVYAVARGGNGGVIKLKKRPGAGSILDRPTYKGGSL